MHCSQCHSDMSKYAHKLDCTQGQGSTKRRKFTYRKAKWVSRSEMFVSQAKLWLHSLDNQLDIDNISNGLARNHAAGYHLLRTAYELELPILTIANIKQWIASLSMAAAAIETKLKENK